jgi:glycosyltransferase involved in cell wall biosynthesis
VDRSHRIALIASSYHPHPGGVEEHVRHLARELAARGHVVAVWTVDRGEHLGTRLVDGIEVRYLPAPLPSRSVRGLLSYAAHFPSAWRAWMGAWRALRPELLNVQCFGPNGLYALALHHRTRTPLAVSAHGETFTDDHDVFAESALLRAGLRRTLRDAGAVTGCSSIVLDDLRGRFGLTDGIVVPNGIDLGETSTEAQPPKWWPRHGPVVMALGRIEHKKGFDLLVRAFARLVTEERLPRSARLVIGGEGSARADLTRLVEELGVVDQVVLPGGLSRADVGAALSRADVFVVPSRVEAFGIVALEAWREGAPLVMTVRGGARDFITDGTDGILVDPEDATALAAAIDRVLHDPLLRRSLTEAGRRRVHDFDWAAVEGVYENVYRTVLETPPR